MPINSLSSKEKVWNQGATDTGPKPGDFPIGSLESRAAARAKVEHAKQHNDELPPEDQDALTLYCGAPMLTSGMSPSYPELEATAVYKRGKEVSERLYGQVTGLPAPSIGTAALLFRMQFGREPVAGDVLRYQDVLLCDLVRYAKFITAWVRQIPELPCPLKIEDNHIFFHEVQEWSGPDEPTLSRWSCAQAEANGGNHLSAKDAHTIPAVVFLGIIDGNHRCRPATASEIRTGES